MNKFNHLRFVVEISTPIYEGQGGPEDLTETEVREAIEEVCDMTSSVGVVQISTDLGRQHLRAAVEAR